MVQIGVDLPIGLLVVEEQRIGLSILATYMYHVAYKMVVPGALAQVLMAGGLVFNAKVIGSTLKLAL
jgi:hypothetical protein